MIRTTETCTLQKLYINLLDDLKKQNFRQELAGLETFQQMLPSIYCLQPGYLHEQIKQFRNRMATRYNTSIKTAYLNCLRVIYEPTVLVTSKADVALISITDLQRVKLRAGIRWMFCKGIMFARNKCANLAGKQMEHTANVSICLQ